MKTTKNLLLAGMLAAFGGSIANAQFSYSNSLAGATLIYSHTFSGGAVDINGTAPAYINPNASSFGGATSASFDVVTNSTANGYYAYQDGTLCANRESVLLPFTPQSGYIYTLSASLTFASTPPSGGWGALGYGAAFPPSNGSVSDPRIGQTLVGGNPWALLNMYANGGGAVFYDTRTHSFPGVANLMTALNTPYTINMVVDTTGAKWYVALFVAGTFVKDSVYTANPTIRSIGYGQTGTTAGAYKWNSLALYASRLLMVQQPAAGYVSPGHAFTNTVVVASATAPSCQWYFNSTSNYAGATALANSLDGRVFSYGTLTNSLVITNLQAADQGYYFAIATNSYGAVTSSIVPLVVPLNVAFTSQLPATYTNRFTLFAGTSPRFSVSTAGEQPIRYQWYTNGVACSGQTNTTFTWANLPVGTITAYCVATNNFSTATSTAWTALVIAAPTAPFPANLLSLQPIGYWRLTEGADDGGGNNGVVTLDYAGGNDGLYTNAVLGITPGYSSSTDPNVSAAYFSSFASPDSDVFNIQGVDFGAPAGTNASFSVSAWVTATGSQTSGAGILAKGYGGAEQFVLDVSGGKYEFAVRDAAGTLHNATGTVGPTGNWDYLVGVCDEAHSNVTLYVNGAPAASVAIAPGSGLLASGVPMTIGARSSSATIGHNDLQFKGFVEDVALFNSALSAGQEATLYTAAGYSIPISYVPPPATFVYQANKTMIIPASAFGATNLGYYWTDTTTGAFLASGAITTYGTLDATLTIPNASPSLSGDQLQLVITNDTSSQSWYVTLYCPPPSEPLPASDPILYSNYFNGGTWSIAGTPLTAANVLVGGTNTTWIAALGTNNTGSLQANGVDASTLGDSWLLPFTPHAGYVYTVTASLTFSGNPNNWVGLGFAQRAPTNAAGGYGRFSDGGATPPQQGPNGYDWLILTESGGTIQYFTGPGGSPAGGITNGSFFTSGAGTHIVTVVLDTTGAQWKYSASVDGTSTLTYTYSSNPPIGAVGITQTSLSPPGVVQWNYFALTQVAPGGVPPYLLAPLPPSNVTLLAGTSLSIPVSAFGSVPVGYYWSNTNTAAVLGAGTTNNVAPLVANLSVSDVPLSWNGNTLALTVTNAYGTNISLVSLTVTNPPTPGPIGWTFTNGLLTLSWSNKGDTLLAQSNSPGVGLGTNWVVVPGSTTITNLVVPVSPANGSVFYRLLRPY
jgi:hypothetical protein